MSLVDKRLTVDDLSEDQRVVYEFVERWTRGATNGDKKMLKVGGYAGTGKSTVLGVFAANTNLLVAYVSFTGRAASVLKRKLKACGVRTTSETSTKDNPQGRLPLCTTLHGMLYKPVVDPETEELKGFEKRTELDRRYGLIVVDEASMISDEMLEDLKIHGIPILAVGDHGQLPPVMSSGSCVENPDVRLEKIHRQAVDNPIIKLSKRLRTRGDLLNYEDPRIEFRSKKEIEKVLRSSEIGGLGTGILCWQNRTRVMLNGLARKARGFVGAPKKGELVIALKNKPPVYNGMRGLLVADAVEPLEEGVPTKRGQLGLYKDELPPVDCSRPRNPWELHAEIAFPDEGLPASPHTLCAAQFNKDVIFKDVEELRGRGIDVRAMSMAGEFYDFGYALTVHRAQGSSFKHAIVYLDRPQRPLSEEWRRWIYTAVTRASEKLTVLL